MNLNPCNPWILSLSSGLLLLLTFPKFDLTFLGWVALTPLLMAVARARSVRRAAAYGFLSGMIFFSGTLYWILKVMVQYGGMNAAVSAGAHFGFMAVLAVFFAIFGALAAILFRGPDRHALWGVPALWVGAELLRTHIFTGFPWLLLGYALADHLLIAQLAKFGGVYFLSFVLAGFSTAVALLARNPTRSRGYALAAAFAVIALGAAGGAVVPVPAAPHTAYLIQAQVPLDTEWTRADLVKLISDLEGRLLSAWARNDARSGLVLWPEMPAPLYYPDDELLRERLHRLAVQMQSPMAASVVAFADVSRRRAYNSAVFIGPSGDFQGRYDKIHLVPFGEYVPLKDSVFFFMEKITTEVSDFVPGGRAAPLGKTRPVGTLICYENIFPDEVRKFTAGGAQVLANLSNDGWYGTSAARDQLLLMSRMRAIENGRWLLRATNTGITAAIDPHGRVRTYPPDERSAYVAGFDYLTGTTPYVGFGYVFPYLAAAGAVAQVAVRIAARRRSIQSEGVIHDRRTSA